MSKNNYQDAFGEKVYKTIDELFVRAKNESEFEYVCALLRIRGIEDQGWDPLEETIQLFNDMINLIQAPLRDSTRLRIGLLAYCHITEVDAIYSIIENMLRIIEGKRASIDPFWDIYKPRNKKMEITKAFNIQPLSKKEVVKHLIKHASKIKENEVSEVIKEIYNDDVRNSFYHSDYIIYKDEYRIRKARSKLGGLGTITIKISDLLEIINNGIHYYEAFMNVYSKHITSYKETKIVYGHISGEENDPEPIELLVVSKKGVYGFKTPPRKELLEREAK